MRGLATIFLGRALPSEEVSSALIICSTDTVCCEQIIPLVQQRFPEAHLTYIAPKEYVRFLPEDAEKISLVDLKRSTLRTSRKIRGRKYDAVVLILTGQPIFRRAKAWALLTNYRMLVIYNENLDCFYCGSDNPMNLVRHLKWRFREKGLSSVAASVLSILLYPLGFLYLLCFTSSVLVGSRLRRGAVHLERERQQTD